MSVIDNSHLVILGSQTARNGFLNEQFVIDEFNSWQVGGLATKWLTKMGYNPIDIDYVSASKVQGSYKADVQVSVRVSIKLHMLEDIQNIQVKLVSNPRGFNQIDKRWLAKYKEMWDIPYDVLQILRHYTGELPPIILNPRDSRRMFIDEFSLEDQKKLIQFLSDNKTLIISDILKGRGKFTAEWMLVVLKVDNKSLAWALEPMNLVLNIFGNGQICITDRGNVKIGNITVQRKGGDNGRPTANMLQFKINPAILIN